MPIISGFVVPKMNPASHVGNIRLLRPVVVAVEHQEYSQTENNKTKDKESQEEVLNVMTEIHSIIFLVPLLNPFALFIEHVIDLSDMLLHRSRHPLLLLGVHFLNLLPVFIFDSD